MTDRPFQAIVLAAGKGTRMKSARTKILHEILGRPMIDYVVSAALDAGAERVVTILGHQRADVEAYLSDRFGERVVVAVQEEQKGTGHAVHCAREHLESGPEWSLILSGDVPNMDAETLEDFVEVSVDSGRVLGLMTAILDDAAQYGRVVRDDEGDVVQIVEYADAGPQERTINEINVGFYVGRSEFLRRELDVLCSSEPDNAQGEYYLPDLIEIAASDGGVMGWPVGDMRKVQGVNTRADLARAIDFARRRINAHWMDEGVTMIDPRSVIIEPDVTLSSDVVLQPGVHLRGATTVGSGTVIENGCVVEETKIGADVHVKPYCHLESSSIDDDSSIGPFAHLRPGADVGRRCKVGNFVEMKKARLDDGAKASHLTYLGDAHIREGANIGAGTITCNYDGEDKHRTDIGRGAFIGSNTALVAPVRVGDGSYVGAGSVITADVPDGALGVARGRQRNIEGWAERQNDDDPSDRS